MEWFAPDSEVIIQARSRFPSFKAFWKEFPGHRWKCRQCFHVVDESPCPVCGSIEFLVEMCPLDHVHCSHDVISGVAFCPVCDEAVCPTCGSHDVVQISRVTGYLQEVSGWNKGKQQELVDRQRYAIK